MWRPKSLILNSFRKVHHINMLSLKIICRNIYCCDFWFVKIISIFTIPQIISSMTLTTGVHNTAILYRYRRQTYTIYLPLLSFYHLDVPIFATAGKSIRLIKLYI